MLHDIILKDSDDNLVGVFKVDISNERTNIEQKQVSVNYFIKGELDPDSEDFEARKLVQEKVEKMIPPMNYLCQDLINKLDLIKVSASLDGIDLVPSTTTTTTEATTTTTTEATTTTTTEEE